MADDNLLDFETFLGISCGRWNGEEPAKPPSARVIALLAHKLERAEHERNQMLDVIAFCGHEADSDPDVISEENGIHCRYWDAEKAYIAAVNARNLVARVKAIRRKTPPRAEDAFTLKDAKYAAQDRRDMLHDLGPEFSTERERIDAQAAACQAEDLFEIAQAKFQDTQREARRDNRAGIVRTSFRRKPQELHL